VELSAATVVPVIVGKIEENEAADNEAINAVVNAVPDVLYIDVSLALSTLIVVVVFVTPVFVKPNTYVVAFVLEIELGVVLDNDAVAPPPPFESVSVKSLATKSPDPFPDASTPVKGVLLNTTVN
jgi:hypothetical protein